MSKFAPDKSLLDEATVQKIKSKRQNEMRSRAMENRLQRLTNRQQHVNTPVLPNFITIYDLDKRYTFRSPPTISVVGNASSLFSLTNGHLVDEANEVIRFNGGSIHTHLCQGSKTTIHAFSMLDFLHVQFCGKVERCYLHPDHDDRQHLTKLFNTKPSNGTIVLEQLSKLKCKPKVKLFGFDWKITPTWYTDVQDSNVHDFDAEREYCLGLIKTNNWELFQ